MTNNKRLPIFALILLLATLLMGMNNAKAQSPNPPTVALTGPPDNTSSELTFTISALFSESTMGFTAEDVVVSNGMAEFNGPFTMTFEQERQSLTITHDGSAPEVVISIPAGSYTDLDGNPSVAQGNGNDTVTVTYTGGPVVSVQLTGVPTGNIGAEFEVTATFTESVTGFTADDIEITNATVTVAGSGATYTLTITPAGANGVIEFGIIADATDGGNVASNRVSVNYDPQPFVTLSGAPSSATGLTPFEVTATFTEDVFTFVPSPYGSVPVNIATTPVMVTNGMGRVKSHSGRIFVLEITPAGTGDSIDIFLPRNAVIDSSFLGNAPSNEVTVAYIDTTPPTVMLTGPASTTELTFEITAVFSEEITGFTADDVEISTGTVALTGARAVSEGKEFQSLQITHDGTISNIVISIPAGTFTDTEDNLNTTASNTLTVANTADDTPPTVTFTTPPANHNGTNTFMVTVALSEPADDFIAGDITFSDNATGTLTGSGTDYTLTVTPTDTNSVTIDIAAGSFTDASNNMNTAPETLTVTYDAAADTTPPTVAMPVPQFSIVDSNDPFEVTVTFSEAVTGFDAVADIMITSATTLAPVAMGDSGTVYTLTVMPGGPSGEIVLSIPAGVAMDEAGNLNTASPTLTLTYTPPLTVALSLANPQFISDGSAPFAVTATFSEAVTTFAVAGVMVANGTATAVNGSGAVYTVTITPDGGNNDAITIQLIAEAGEVDNGGGQLPKESQASEVLQVMVMLDIIPPTVTLTGPDPATFSSTEAFVVTATFSETVTGFDAVTDITVTGGTAAVPVAVSVSSNERTYTLTITPDGMGDIGIIIPAEAAMDEAGNLNTASETLTVTYTDTTPPTVTLMGAPTTANGSTTTFEVTATFDESVTGLTAAEIEVTNATVTIAGTGTTYTLTITPTTDGTITITIPANVAADDASTGNMASNTVSVTYDGTPPTVTLSEYPTTANASTTTFTVTATFSEPVTGFDAIADITVTGGTAIAPIAVNNTTYTLTITPTTDGTITITIPANVAADDASNDNTASNEVSVTYDATAPTVMLTGAPATANASDTTFAVTATFSEPVTGFEAAEIDITNATVMLAGSGTTYTLTLSPTTPRRDGEITITIPANVAADDASNDNTASNEVSVPYDATAPAVMLTGAPATANASDTTFAVTATFSEPVTGFDEAADITVTNGAATIAGSGTTYTLTITPDGTGNIGITIPANVAADAANNPNTASETLTVTYTDTTAPTVEFTDVPANHNGTNTFMVTVALSEPADDFIAGDITFSDNASGTLTGSGTDYTLTVTPTDTNSVTIDIAAGSFTDASNNMNTAPETLTVTYDAAADTTRPTVVGLVPEFSIVDSNDSFEVTVTFSEAVTGFDAVADIMITSGTTLAPVAMDGSETTYILTITPGGPRGEIVISIPANVAMDAAGNLNTASTTLRLTYDPPVTVALSLANPQFISDGSAPFAVTATFSEAVTTFAVAGVMVANGTATAVNGSGAVYTVTITPDGGSNDAITIQLIAGAGEVDTGGGRLPEESLASEVLQVMVLLDIIPPTVALTGAPATYSSRDAFVVTATFSEAVTGFDAMADITVTNGATTVPVAVSNSETTYTLNITPDGSNLNIEIAIPPAAAMDTATNPNTASDTVTVTYTDTTPPTVMLTGPDPATYSSTDAFVVTATFSANVTGFDAVTDITVTNGATAVPVAMGNSGTTYTLTITPTTDGTITITIPAGVAENDANNGNTASETLTVTYAAPADTTPPTVMLSAPDAVNGLDPFAVTATFSEPVTGFDATAVTVTNGEVTEVTSVTDLVSSSLAQRSTLTRQLNARATARSSSLAQRYTLTIVPDGMGTITIAIPAGVVMDAARNGNTASTNAAGNTAPVSVAYDTTAPTVTLTGPDPATFSTEAFVVTATFSEDVTGFDAVADITVTNGTAAVPVAVGSSETTYTLTITPDGTNGDIEITIPADVATDLAANGNTASNTLTVVNTIVADTKAAITGFMLDRANKLASNQPGLARFLQGTGCGTFSANSTDASGSVDGCLSNGHTWGEISRTWSSDNAYTLATVGLHGLMRDDLIIGGLVQFDKADDDKRNITGQGWLVGPYFVRKPTDQNMAFEGRLLYGQTDNDISAPDSYTDSFDTERYLAQLRVTGEYGYDTVTLMPSLDLTYTEDTQQAYKLLDEQGIDLTQLTFGMDFKLPIAIQTGQLDLTGGLSGTYSETNGGESDVDGGRGRTELGLNYSRANGSGNGTTLRLGTFYDGISSDHESYGANLSFDIKF